MNQKITAAGILRAGIAHMEDRAVTYDKPQGKRSMGMTVALMNILIADKLKAPLSEEDGWNFMELLKLVRSKQGAFKADNYEDRAAYGGLAGEAAFVERVLMPELAKMHAPCSECGAVFDGPCGMGGGSNCRNPKNAALVPTLEPSARAREIVDPADVEISLESSALTELAILTGSAPAVEECPEWATALLYHPEHKRFAWSGNRERLPVLQWINGEPVSGQDTLSLKVYAYIDEDRKLQSAVLSRSQI